MKNKTMNRESEQVMKQPAKGTGRVAWGAVPLHLMRHQFKPGMAYMQKLAKGKRGR
jgi:hypothetical protein